MNSKALKKGNYVMHEGDAYIIQDYSMEGNQIRVFLQSLFRDSSKQVLLGLDSCFEEADIKRKCASILFKKKGKIEIMDSFDFSVHQIDASKCLLDDVVEGDEVTYIKFNDKLRILEIRKS